MNSDWLNDPRLNDISPEKKTLLITFAEQASTCKGKAQLMEAFMKMQKKMKEQQLTLTPEESGLMIRILKESMSEAEQKKLSSLLSKMPKG